MSDDYSDVPSPDDKSKRSVKRLGILARLLALMAPYKARFILATLTLFIGSGLALSYPQAARIAIDDAIATGSLSRLNQIAFVLLGVFLVGALLTWVRHYL